MIIARVQPSRADKIAASGRHDYRPSRLIENPQSPVNKTSINTCKRILTDWYLLGINRAEAFLDLVELAAQVAASLGDLGQLGGEAREDVLGGGQEGS